MGYISKTEPRGMTYTSRCIPRSSAPGRGIAQNAAVGSDPRPRRSRGGRALHLPMHPEIVRDAPGVRSAAWRSSRSHPRGRGRPDRGDPDMTRRLSVSSHSRPGSSSCTWLATGRTCPLPGWTHGSALAVIELRTGKSRGALGRRTVLTAAPRVIRHARSEHVHPDRYRRRRRVSLFDGGAPGARDVPACLPPMPTAKSHLRRRLSSPLSCSAKVWNCARGDAHRAQFARCSNSRRARHA